MITLQVKPLSVNKVWQGRRFKTKDYLNYELEVGYLLPKVSYKGEVSIDYVFYLKNYLMTDVDNLIKPLQDILVKNSVIEDDRKITSFTAKKIKSENNYIEITINELSKISDNTHL